MIEDIKLFVINKKDWLVALLLILTGGMIYVLYRPESLLLFRVTDSLSVGNVYLV